MRELISQKRRICKLQSSYKNTIIFSVINSAIWLCRFAVRHFLPSHLRRQTAWRKWVLRDLGRVRRVRDNPANLVSRGGFTPKMRFSHSIFLGNRLEFVDAFPRDELNLIDAIRMIVPQTSFITL